MSKAQPLRRTVFVLGAGASKPFGLPTGLELRHQILARCTEAEAAVIYGRESGGHDATRELEDFGRAFRRSGARSIDTFLEDNPDLQAVGKYLIAATILPREHHAITSDLICEDWMSWLLNSVKNAEHLLYSGTLSFVTFNYDRLLEAAIYQYFRYQRHRSDGEAWAAVSKCTIHHVYGELDDDIRTLLHGDRQPLEKVAAYRRAFKAAGSIKIISDHRDDATSPVLEQCKSLVKRADAIVCLGFGFDRTNVLRIGMQGIAVPDRVVQKADGNYLDHVGIPLMASVFGMHKAERNVASRLVGHPDNVLLGEPTHGCETVLRDLCIELFSRWYCES